MAANRDRRQENRGNHLAPLIARVVPILQDDCNDDELPGLTVVPGIVRVGMGSGQVGGWAGRRAQRSTQMTF